MTQLQRFKEEIGPILETIDTANSEAIDVYASIWNTLGRHIETEAAKAEPMEGGDLISSKAVQQIIGKYVGADLFREFAKLPTYSPPDKPKAEPIFELTPKGHEIYPNVKNLQKPELYWRVDWALDVKACLKHGILQEVKPERIELIFPSYQCGTTLTSVISRADGKQLTEEQKQRMEDAINES
jgi:hypothetical protein